MVDGESGALECDEHTSCRHVHVVVLRATVCTLCMLKCANDLATVRVSSRTLHLVRPSVLGAPRRWIEWKVDTTPQLNATCVMTGVMPVVSCADIVRWSVQDSKLACYVMANSCLLRQHC